MRRKKDSFMDLLEYYFNTYLPVAKGLSEATIISYKATFRILMEFMYTVKSVPSDKVSFEILDSQMLSDFLDWLEMERGCNISTRNQRLSALAAFAIYVQNRDFGTGAVFRNNISKIPKKKAPRQGRSSDYLRGAGHSLGAFLQAAARGETYPERMRSTPIYWHAVPHRTVRALASDALVRECDRCVREGFDFSPFRYEADYRLHPLRRAYLLVHAHRRGKELYRYAAQP